MSLIQALILGVVQGLSEFLPISSSGHLILVPWLLGWGQSGLTFDVALHVGTTLAVLLYFGRDWVRLIGAVLRGLTNRSARQGSDWRLAWMIVLGSVPAAIAGAALGSTVEEAIRQPLIVAALLVVFGLLLGYADRVAPRTRRMGSLTLRDALIIGVAQAIALVPGVSRSGITLTAGLLLGLDRPAAARFSFLLSAPVIVGAVLFEAFKVVRAGGLQGDGTVFAVGIAASAITGLIAIRFLLGYLQRHSVSVFVGYRVVVGTAMLLLTLVR
jgi:undecaprenyl-diphosphatase